MELWLILIFQSCLGSNVDTEAMGSATDDAVAAELSVLGIHIKVMLDKMGSNKV